MKLRRLKGETFYKIPKLLSRGTCEGIVYKISNLRIKKVWNGEWNINCYGHKRWEKLIEYWETVPTKYRQYMKLPHYYGHKIIKGKIVTYHQYIPDNRKKINLRKFTDKLCRELEGYCRDRLKFFDLDNFSYLVRHTDSFNNVKFSNGKFYLIDPLID